MREVQTEGMEDEVERIFNQLESAIEDLEVCQPNKFRKLPKVCLESCFLSVWHLLVCLITNQESLLTYLLLLATEEFISDCDPVLLLEGPHGHVTRLGQDGFYIFFNLTQTLLEALPLLFLLRVKFCLVSRVILVQGDHWQALDLVGLYSHIQQWLGEFCIQYEELPLKELRGLCKHGPPHYALPIQEGLPILEVLEEGDFLNAFEDLHFSLPIKDRDEIWLPSEEVHDPALTNCQVIIFVFLIKGYYLEIVEIRLPVAVAKEICELRVVYYQLIELKRARLKPFGEHVLADFNSRLLSQNLKFLRIGVLNGFVWRFFSLAPMACLFFILMHFKDGKGFFGKVGFIAWIVEELL